MEISETYTWLLEERARCPACGAPLAEDAVACPACRRSFSVIVKPPERSVPAVTLAGAWSFGLVGAVLALLGAGLEITGVTPRTNSPTVLGWLVGVCLVGGLLAGIMAWGCWNRRMFALYVGSGLTLLACAAAVVAAAQLRSPLAISLCYLAVLVSIPLLMNHLSVWREFRGVPQRLDLSITGHSATDLDHAGRTFYRDGLRFLAAQCWARAVGLAPQQPQYLQALALALAELGYRERALMLLDHSLAVEQHNPEMRQARALIERLPARPARQPGR